MGMVGEQERRDRFGYALQQALNTRGMSERQLALKLEIDPRRVAKWRTGRGLPDLYETQALAQALRVDAEAHWTTGYMAAANDRMQALGCY